MKISPNTSAQLVVDGVFGRVFAEELLVACLPPLAITGAFVSQHDDAGTTAFRQAIGDLLRDLQHAAATEFGGEFDGLHARQTNGTCPWSKRIFEAGTKGRSETAPLRRWGGAGRNHRLEADATGPTRSRRYVM